MQNAAKVPYADPQNAPRTTLLVIEGLCTGKIRGTPVRFHAKGHYDPQPNHSRGIHAPAPGTALGIAGFTVAYAGNLEEALRHLLGGNLYGNGLMSFEQQTARLLNLSPDAAAALLSPDSGITSAKKAAEFLGNMNLGRRAGCAVQFSDLQKCAKAVRIQNRKLWA